ncbi:restriction endonuclease subunit S [Levilactobacillus brevis]|uniref:restriction endonuclease subunit S n=1 Tax=Levilactobacillus brevis TaxID=1580 RepID=UPI001C1EBA77|nr:restriction endonuclease subunit S [Levilactobacillus brevis]MBU7540820.1 restriction endonuclease subunit S [Levilactobacillus brevis]MBU7566985.1 restriction endonuclease subunit S [Levilactobacillus brevis]MCE6039627.1 restriction endonuclease subunit S [Levilactobacillus brevis]
MAKIDDSVKKKVPELRFKGFTDEWEDRKFFESIASTIDFRGRTPKKLGMDWSESGYLALSALNVKNGYIDPLADAHYGDENLYKKWMSGKELKKGQVLFTTEAPMGNVAQVPDNNGYILSQRTVAFETKEDMMTNDFLAVLLKSPLVFNNLSALSSGGTAKGVSQKSLKGLSITVPFDIDEQQKIGSFFKQLDDTIALHQRKLDLLKEQKKGYLQKMFPKNGAKVPELRFAGFADDWEERKLGDITKISTGKLDANAMVENGKYDFYTSGIKKYRIDVAAFEGPSITIAGNGATVGYMHLADNKFNAYQRTYVLQEFLVDRSFIFSEIGNKLPKKIKQEARTGNIPYIVMDMLTELKVSIPQNDTEQKKIGDFFKQLDDTIALHQRKLDLLKEQKKGFLQKMFV